MGCTVVCLTGLKKLFTALLDVSIRLLSFYFIFNTHELWRAQLYIGGFANSELADKLYNSVTVGFVLSEISSHRHGWELNSRLGALHAILCCRVP